MKIGRVLLILAVIPLPFLVFHYWNPIRGGELEGVVVIGLNLVVIWLLAVYSLDR
jgi:hypothetical protein